MWFIALIFFGLILGVGTGYKITHKKVVPFVKFVEKGEKESVLEKHGVQLTEASKCSICGDNIGVENIGAVVLVEGDNTFICSRPQCMTVSDILKPVSKAIKR